MRFHSDPNLKGLYHNTIDTIVEKGLVKLLGVFKVKGTFGEKTLSATTSSAQPEQAWQSKKCLQCRIEVQ